MRGIIERRNNGDLVTPPERTELSSEKKKKIEGRLHDYAHDIAGVRADIDRHAVRDCPGAISNWRTSTRHHKLITRRILLQNGGAISPAFHLSEGETLEEACLLADTALRAEGWPIPEVDAYEVRDV